MVRTSEWTSPECPEWSEDGYVRLTFQRFCRLSFTQRLIIPDEELCRDLQARDVPAFGAGYCDWLDTSTPVRISVGWTWFITAEGAPQCLAPGWVRSNVMITSPRGYDLGVLKTNELLKAWLSSQIWQEVSRLPGRTRDERAPYSMQ